MDSKNYKTYNYQTHCFRAYSKYSEEEIFVMVVASEQNFFLDILLGLRKDWVIGSGISITEFYQEVSKCNSYKNPTVHYNKSEQGIETLKIQIQHVQTITIDRRKYWTNREYFS